jgi:subtilisin family serine protease
MKYVILMAAVYLAACGSGSTSAPLICASNQVANPFEVGGKIQISDENSSSMEYLLNPIAPSMDSQQPTEVVLNQGTELVAVVDEQCVMKSGRAPLSSALYSQESTEPTKGGMKSVRWTLPYSVRSSELEDLAKSDDCLVGISNALDLDVNADEVDPRISEQTHLKAIRAPEAYPKFFGAENGIRKDVIIAIVDTGVDINHEDLKGNLWVNPDEIPGNGVDDDRNGYIDDVNGYNFPSRKGNPNHEGTFKSYYHGTHVAGLAAAQMGNGRGGSGSMGKHGKIMALNVFGKNPGASTHHIENAIRYAADNGASVINLSLGGSGKSASSQAAYAYAVKKGVVIMAAASNDNKLLTTANMRTPASYGQMYPGMITVGSTDVKTGLRSYFSNYGTQFVEIGAPGSDSTYGSGILSTMPGNKYGRLQGTSMAAPVAAGSAALIIGILKTWQKSFTPAFVEQLMTATGRSDSRLTKYFKGGKVIDLKNAADTLFSKYSGMGGSVGSPSQSAFGGGEEGMLDGCVPVL